VVFVCCICSGVIPALIYLFYPPAMIDFIGYHFSLIPAGKSSINNFFAAVTLLFVLCFIGTAVHSIIKYKGPNGFIRAGIQFLSMLCIIAFSLYLCSFVIVIVFGMLIIWVFKSGLEGTAAYFDKRCPNCGSYGAYTSRAA